jgi:ascorbate-specific PTS system EIIC-type component UlaA
MTPQEASMATRNTAPRSLKSIAGAFLLALGLLILSANLDEIGACMSAYAGISAPQEPVAFPALSLAALHAAQTYAFDHARFLPSLLRILVSFWPMILILVGVLLLRDPFRASFLGRADAGSGAMGRR